MHKDWLRGADSTVTFRAFMPHKGAVSVFRIRRLPEQEVWRIGRAIAMRAGKTLYGRGDLVAQSVLSRGLVIDPDNDPEHHANLVGWPDQKEKQKLLAMELAKAAVLRQFH